MKIVSLVPSSTETLFELGLGDQLVGRTRFCKLPLEAQRIPHVGGTKNPRLSAILALKPDIVIMDEDENRQEDARVLRQAGIPLFTALPKDVADSIALVRRMGMEFKAKERAQILCDEMTRLGESVQRSARIRTVVLIWPKPFITVNSDTYVHNLCKFFGLDPLFGERSERYPRLDPEEIRSSYAEALLLPTDPYPFQPKHRSQLAEIFPDLPAIRSNRVLICDGTYLTWHGYATLRALREFPRILQEGGFFE